MTPQLDGRAAIVTGGSSGIGLATAARLVAQGARVTLAGRDADRLAEAEALLDAADRVRTCRADVRAAGDVERLIASAIADWGRLDVLVNSAGIGVFAPIETFTPSQWRDVMDTNVTGVFLCCQAAIPALRRQGGWIVNIGSLAGAHPFADGGAYCASKAALHAFTESLMQELRHEAIRVCCVLPGSVDTNFSRSPRRAEGKLQADDVARAIVDLLAHDPRSLPSRIELRPARPTRA